MNIPEINPDHIKILWINNWYDGPLEGMCHLTEDYQLENTMYYFKLIDVLSVDLWLYHLYKLTDDQLRIEICKHGDFVQHVGDYWTMLPNGQQGTFKPKSEHHKYYDVQYPELELDDDQIIGRTKNL